MYDPNDEQDLTTIAQYKGQRYCFISAIVDAYHSVPDFELTDAQKAGLLHDTLDIFGGGNNHTKDYYGMFNHAYFVGWMRKLLYDIKNRTLITLSSSWITPSITKRSQMTPHTWVRKRQSYLANVASKASRCQIKA